MFSYFFRQLFNSFGIFFRTIRAFFTRRFIGMGAKLRRMTNFSRHATQVASASFQGAAAAMKNPTRREDYVETKWLFVSKSFLIKLLLGLIVLGCLIYFVVWPFLLSRFFTAHFWQEEERAKTWSGKVVVYYDKEKEQPMYEGRLTEGVLQGQGAEYSESGLVTYEGEYIDGLRTGHGTSYAEGVLVYDGEFEAGSYHGEGALYENGILTYEGDFEENMFSGSGTLYDEAGALLYRGGFAGGVYDGEGVLYAPDGSERYAGGFSEGLYDGEGRLMDEDGALLYEGGFLEGLYHGEGTLYNDGGLLYKGGFSQGLRSGEGTAYHANGNVRYRGGFSEDQWNGQGAEYREDGSIRFKGGFSEGLYSGESTLYLDDDRGCIEADFVAGKTDGDIRWLIDNKLWYAGGAEDLVSDGFGELYTRSGKKIYAGEMDRGTIDGHWLLGLTAEEVREAFAEATITEKAAADGGFFIKNRELGVVVRCMYRSEESDTSVFSVWISRENTEEAWRDVAVFDRWTEELKTDTSMAELMFWNNAEAFASWVRQMPEGAPVDQLVYPQHLMQKNRYYFDGWFCTAAIDPGTGIPNMVSWTVGEPLPVQEELAVIPEEVQAVQEEVNALLEELTQLEEQMQAVTFTPTPAEEESPEAADGAETGETSQEGSEAQSPDGASQNRLTAANADEQKILIDSLLDYYENTWILTSLRSTQPQLEEQLTAAAERLVMGAGSQSQVDELRLQADAYQLRISQSTANLEKSLLAIREITEFDPETFALESLLLCFDPAILEEDMVCGEAAEEDLVAVKASLINLRVSYETVQYSRKSMENAIGAAQTAADDYARGAADLADVGTALLNQSDAVVRFYSALIGFARELNTLNHLTGGWLAQQSGWLGEIIEIKG